MNARGLLTWDIALGGFCIAAFGDFGNHSTGRVAGHIIYWKVI